MAVSLAGLLAKLEEDPTGLEAKRRRHRHKASCRIDTRRARPGTRFSSLGRLRPLLGGRCEALYRDEVGEPSRLDLIAAALEREAAQIIKGQEPVELDNLDDGGDSDHEEDRESAEFTARRQQVWADKESDQDRSEESSVSERLLLEMAENALERRRLWGDNNFPLQPPSWIRRALAGRQN